MKGKTRNHLWTQTSSSFKYPSLMMIKSLLRMRS